MVCNMFSHSCRATNSIIQRLSEDKGCSLVLTPCGLFDDSYNVQPLSDTPRAIPFVSIVICTYGRPESLNETLISLTKQTFKDFEILLITEKGNLSELRQRGLRCSGGDIVSFIDDDVYCPPTWLEGVVAGFREGVVGVSGPTVVPHSHLSNRDIFRWRRLKNLYDFLFLDGNQEVPGYLSSCGAPSTASNYPNGRITCTPHYLEACNMSVKKDDAIAVGGFEGCFISTSEWCEVDLALKLRSKGKLVYSKDAYLNHKPSKAGIYKSRLSTTHRWKNFMYFQKKWIKPSLKTYIYRGFIWTYLKMKNLQMI